jgi:protein involved in sex pheromone biosynthesis
MNGEREGYDRLIAISEKYERMDWFKDALDYTVKQWTKRGMRSDKMVASSLGHIADAFEDLQYESKQPSFDARKYLYCQGQWTFRFDMVRYCYKED